MAFTLEELPALDEGSDGMEIDSGWLCHSCKTVTSVDDLDLSWNSNAPQVCENEDCRHVRCDFCQSTNNLSLPLQHEYSSADQGMLDADDLMDRLQDLESSKLTWKPPSTQSVIAEVEASTIKGLLESEGNLEIPIGIDDSTFDELLHDLMNPEPSEAMRAAILQDLLDMQNDPEAEYAVDDATIDDDVNAHPREEAMLPTILPRSTLPLTPSLPPPRPRIPCPNHRTHACTRTFQRAHHATRHAQIHTHHILCPSPRCASRFKSHSSLQTHTSRVHDPLQNIFDLEERFKGPLVADALTTTTTTAAFAAAAAETDGVDGSNGRMGKYRCRFRELLGCRARFGQNGHANRHALGHCRKALACRAVGCRAKFMLRGNWMAHLWHVHGMAAWG